MYYRYWMHNGNDHHVPAHYGVRTERYKLIYYYGKPLGMKGAIPPDTAPSGSCSTCGRTRARCTTSTPTRPTRGP